METLAKQGQSLEELFFAEHNKRLIEKARHAEARSQTLQRLQEASGISDEKVLSELLDLHIHPETLAALSLIPLIEVSWSDGEIDDKECAAILATAEERGIAKKSAAHELLERWLHKKPAPTMFKAWRSYAHALLAALPTDARIALRDDILARARKVADAAGGFWGMGNRVSDKEQAALDAIQKALS